MKPGGLSKSRGKKPNGRIQVFSVGKISSFGFGKITRSLTPGGLLKSRGKKPNIRICTITGFLGWKKYLWGLEKITRSMKPGGLSKSRGKKPNGRIQVFSVGKISSLGFGKNNAINETWRFVKITLKET